SQKEPLGAIAEVLDLTHDQHSPFKLEFDDHDFKNHLTSLKPLGIAILVNTCCPLTQAHYAKFCGHVTAAAMLDKDLVPVTNRYAIVESSLNCFMHGYVLDIPTSSFLVFLSLIYSHTVIVSPSSRPLNLRQHNVLKI
uniref:Uncharacterized protein n=1 Tax=Anopheles maculatus TaxID=74869 RepID=A0A182SP89_9DIPT